MLEGSCACGAVRWKFLDAPSSATACNCTLCRRYGVLWAYGHEGENIQLTGGPTKAYVRGDYAGFHFCLECGCVAYWRALDLQEGRRRAAVNLRLSEPEPVSRIPVRHLDGLETWKELPRPAHVVGDLWF